MQIHNFIQLFQNVKKQNKGWMACCPAHDDKNPSLSINEGDNGVILVKCFANCKTEDVVKAVSLTMRDLMPEGVNVNDKPVHRAKKVNNVDEHPKIFKSMDEICKYWEDKLGPMSVAYIYHEADGEIFGYQLRWNFSERNPKKTFRPIRRVEGGYVNGGEAHLFPLFNLSEILKADVIYVCEGETATKALGGFGYTVTTSLCGAHSVGRVDVRALAGKKLVFVPDNDATGEKYVAEFIGRLSDLKPMPTVKIVPLPGVSEKGDIVDFIENHGGDIQSAKTQFDELVEQAPLEVLPEAEQNQHLYEPFPVELLPDPLAKYIGKVASSICCDPAYVVSPLLAACATALGSRFRIRIKAGWCESANLWMMVIGKSGTAKTPAQNAALDPLNRMQAEAFRNYQEEMIAHRIAMQEHEAAQAQWQKKREGDPPEMPQQPVLERFVANDITIESLQKLLAENPLALLLVFDEMQSFFSSLTRYNSRDGGDIGRYLPMFNGKPVWVDRRSDTHGPMHVPAPYLSICGAIQPQVLWNLLGRENVDNGLLARFLLVGPPAQPKEWRSHGVTEKDKSKIYNLMTRLRTLTPGHAEQSVHYEIPFNESAQKVWAKFYDEHAKETLSQDDDLSSAFSKLECYTARLALLIWSIKLAANDPSLNDHRCVDRKSLESAIALARWFGREAMRVYSSAVLSSDDRERINLIEFIRNQGSEISASDLMRSNRRYRKQGTAKAALDDLVENSFGTFYQPEQNGKGRPPSPRFKLNPVNQISRDDQ